MIPCSKCGKVNPMTTMFCHGCGTRLSLTLGQVANSVANSDSSKRDQSILASGRSALSLACFLLGTALIVRYVMVPELPPADLPTAPEVVVIGKDLPAWASAVAVGTQAKIDFAPKGRLAWRAANAAGVLSSIGVPFAPLRERQQTIMATQKKDGSFPGGDDICATALATLALQAWPRDAQVIAAAANGRAYLDANWKNLGRKPPLARALAYMAMADAQAGTELRARLGALAVDGSSPQWQAFALASTVPAERQPELAALRIKLTNDLWGPFLDAIAGTKSQLEARMLFIETAKGLTTGEQRLLWATVGWLAPLAPKDWAEAMKIWAGAASAPVDPEFAKACGTNAADAVMVLTITVPVRVSPFQRP